MTLFSPKCNLKLYKQFLISMIIMLIKYFVFFQVRVGYFLRKETRNQTAEKLLIKLLLLLQLLVYGHPPHGHIIVIASGDYKLL